MPAPTRDVKTLLTLLRLHLEAQPPEAPILAFELIAHPDRPRQAQLTLFGPEVLSPDKLATTVARLFALLGDGRVGSPRTVDGHRPERFALVPYEPPPPPKERRPPGQGRGFLTVRTLRPPLPLEVVTDGSDVPPEPTPSAENVDATSEHETDEGEPQTDFTPTVDAATQPIGQARPLFVKTVVLDATTQSLRIEGRVQVASGPWGMEESLVVEGRSTAGLLGRGATARRAVSHLPSAADGGMVCGWDLRLAERHPGREGMRLKIDRGTATAPGVARGSFRTALRASGERPKPATDVAQQPMPSIPAIPQAPKGRHKTAQGNALGDDGPPENDRGLPRTLPSSPCPAFRQCPKPRRGDIKQPRATPWEPNALGNALDPGNPGNPGNPGMGWMMDGWTTPWESGMWFQNREAHPPPRALPEAHLGRPYGPPENDRGLPRTLPSSPCPAFRQCPKPRRGDIRRAQGNALGSGG